MKTSFVAILLLFFGAVTSGAGSGAVAALAATTSRPPATAFVSAIDSSRFLDALALVESGNRNHASGDHGRSIGAYQFTRPAWEQASRLRADALGALVGTNFHVYAWRYARDPFIARLHADYYWRWIAGGLSVALKREPTPGEIYAGYNLGPSGFWRYHNKLKFCPATTRLAALKIERLMK